MQAVGLGASFLADLGLPQSLAMSPGLLHGPTPNMAADIPQNVREEQKPQSFYNLISEVTSHHFCLGLVFRSEILSPFHTQGEGITQGHEYREVGIIRAILAVAY